MTVAVRDKLQTSTLATDILSGVEKAVPDEVIEFINTTVTSMGKGTFYNMAEEQRAALLAKHLPVLKASRPLYTLMMLPPGVTDINKQLIIYNLLRTSATLETEQHGGPTQKLWENAVMLETLKNMRSNRALNLGFQFTKGVVTSEDGGVAVRPGIHNRRTKKLMRQYLEENRSSLSLWFVKYQRQMRSWARHLHLGTDFHPGVSFLFDSYQGGDRLIDGYLKVQQAEAKQWYKLSPGVKEAFKSLPFTVAEGFLTKFGLTRKKLLEMFSEEQEEGKPARGMTKRERLRQKSEGERSGVDTGVKLEKLDLWDLLVFLNQEARTNNRTRQGSANLLQKAAQRVGRKLGLQFNDVAVVMDTSLSMIGTQDSQYHPLLRGMAVRYILESVSETFAEFRTTDSDTVFPILHGQSNYAAAILKALKAGFKNIVVIGDGYENAPFEGAAHQLIWTFKKKIDTDDGVSFIHLNPVFAAESKDVRALSDLAPTAGVLDHKNLGTAIYLAMSKSNPAAALKLYIKWLIEGQSEGTRELMQSAGVTQQMLLP